MASARAMADGVVKIITGRERRRRWRVKDIAG
jgi:hypothetical protein